ncbi:hypothetical protein EYF80_029257 [Liparis tanakae]|uniref:Uncharacterized protein n=1 Tax=Liparis tanakae TaxID=230148 RepID=A0A4Z2H6U2_9TELE|nr:hypothetical protein EYF80_029257 [Liparis tanakae]
MFEARGSPLDGHSPLLEPSCGKSRAGSSGAERGLLWAAAMEPESWDVCLRYSSCADDTSPTGSARIARTPAEKERESCTSIYLDIISLKDLVTHSEGSPHATCDGERCGSNVRAGPTRQVLEPGRSSHVISGQLAAALFEREAGREAKNRSCKNHPSIRRVTVRQAVLLNCCCSVISARKAERNCMCADLRHIPSASGRVRPPFRVFCPAGGNRQIGHILWTSGTVLGWMGGVGEEAERGGALQMRALR